MNATRASVGALGVALIGYGAYRLLTEIAAVDLRWIVVWLVFAVAVHDGVVAPLTAGVGVMIRRFVPARARRYVSGALVAATGVSVVAVPLVLREGTQPPAKELLRQDYGAHLLWLWAAVGVAAAGLYVVRVLRDRRSAPGRDQ